MEEVELPGAASRWQRLELVQGRRRGADPVWRGEELLS